MRARSTSMKQCRFTLVVHIGHKSVYNLQAKLLELRSYACAPQQVLELADPETIGPLVAELYDLRPPLSTSISSSSIVKRSA